MSIISAVIGAVAASGGGGGGGGSKSSSWYGITWEPVQEGQENHAQVQFTNWDNSTVYWTVVGTGGSNIGDQLAANSGVLSPGSGDSVQDIYFTFNADRATDGNLTYYVYIGSSSGANDLVTGGPFTCRDSSKATALILDLDPANYNPSNVNVWPDSTGNAFDAGIYSYGFLSDHGGVMNFNGGTSCEVTSLASGWDNYGSITLSIWFNATAVSGAGNQTLIAKESLFKVRITDTGTINVQTSSDGSSWNAGGGSTSGGENLTAGFWNHLALCIKDDDNIRLYLNGSEVANFSQTILGRNNNPFNIGMWQTTGSPSDFFTGFIGEVMMWNYGLTGDQVSAYYLSTLNRYIPQVPAFDFYNPPSGAGTDWNDATTSTVTATIVGSWTYDSNFGGGVVFDGTPDSYIEIQGANCTTASFTISMAAKFNQSTEHYCPVFDGSSQDRTGTDIWANFWYGLGMGTQNDGFTLDYNGTVDGTIISWWDFVYDGVTVTGYQNGVLIGTGTLTAPNTGWHSNLRIGNEYNQPNNVMPGTFYRIKYQKAALTQSQIIDQYNSVAGMYDLPLIPLSLVFNSTNSYLKIDPEYTVLGSEAVGAFGSIDHLNILKGSYPTPQAGWVIRSTATSDSSLFSATVTSVEDHGGYWTLNFATHALTYTLGTDGPHQLYPTNNAWNLGTSWTIEFWIKPAAPSTTAIGSIWGLLNQGGWSTPPNSINIALVYGELAVGQGPTDNDVRYTEPAVGVWTHVAIVNNSGSQTVFYNGIEQTKTSGTYDTASYTNTIDPLYIGRLAPSYGGYFNGELADVRIANRPLYSPPIVQTDVNAASNTSTTGIFDTLNYSSDLTGYIVNGTGIHNGVVNGYDGVTHGVGIQGQLFQPGETYTFTAPPFVPPVYLFNEGLYGITTGTMLVLDATSPTTDQSGFSYGGAYINSTTVGDPLTYLDFLSGSYGILAYGVREGDYIVDNYNPTSNTSTIQSIVDNGSSITIGVLTSWFTTTNAGGTDIVSIHRDSHVVTNTNVTTNVDMPTTSTVALGSLYFDRVSNGYLTLNGEVILGTSNFTIEFWINPTSLSGFNTILSCPTDFVQDGLGLYIYSSILTIDPHNGSNNSWDLNGYLKVGRWHHIAIARNNLYISAWINGHGVGQQASYTNYNTTGDPATIGKLWFGGSRSDMQLSNLRIIVGGAQYEPTQPTITIPTQPLDTTPSTTLLLSAASDANAFLDSSGNYTPTNHNAVWIAGPVKRY